MIRYCEIDHTIYLWFGANDTAGSGNDGASAVFDVRLGGAAADAAPVFSGSATLLSHADYPAGCYEIAIAVTAANGFAADSQYAVFCTLAVDSQNPTGLVGAFNTMPVKSDVLSVLGTPADEPVEGNSLTDIHDTVKKIPRSATELTAGAAAKHTRTGGTTNEDEVTIEPVV